MRNFLHPFWLLGFAILCGATATAAPRHGVAMHGEVRLGPDFTQFEYVNPGAPKGGMLVLGERGGFDNLNPFTVRGVVPLGIREWVFESLLKRSNDEAFSLYAWVAQAVEVAPDRSWVSFTLDPRARFSDGTPIRVQDVIFSAEILREKGRPNHRSYYAKITRISQPGRVRCALSLTPQTLIGKCR
jgi:peptide/nickel transport system substrate-binding protein